uniref:MAM domain-containing protein n=1 Tax=Octopus bimaculoides TaxID=37653 RepID=A0A0L8I0T1_OCTBM
MWLVSKLLTTQLLLRLSIYIRQEEYGGVIQLTNISYYLYIETSAPRIGGDVARIMSPVLPPVTGGYCFEMAYFMFGSHVSMLTVSLRNHNRETILWIRSGNIGPYWNITRIGFSVSESSQLIIAGVVGESYRSDIAIDDTVLTRGPC